MSQGSADEPAGRLEDHRLLTGKGNFVDDINIEGQAYMGIVRSTFAHARITGIDFSKAESSPDFIAGLTGEDLVKEGVTPILQNPWPPQHPSERYHLAVGKVRFSGEPVAAVLSRRKIAVEDLVELVEVSYDPLPALTTVEDAKRAETLVYDDWGDNLSQSSESKWGRPDEAFASAPHVITAREGIQRQESAPIEPHAALAMYHREDGTYEVYATVQSAHALRQRLAAELRMPQERFHAIVKDVGGGFGSKGAQSYPEPLLACIFSRRTGLPVKWTATRIEEFEEAAAGRDEYCDVSLACDAEGKIVALKASIECDAGVTGTQNHMAQLSMWSMLGPYSIPNVDLRVAVYATNKMPLGPVRGAGAPEGCYFIERAVSALAEEMGMDALEMRRRNLAGAPRWGGEARGAEDYGRMIDSAVRNSRYKDLLDWRESVNSKFREGTSSVVAGIGVSIRGGGESFGGRRGGEGGQERGAPRAAASGRAQDARGPWPGGQREAGARPTGGSPRPEESGRPSLDFMSETGRVTIGRDGRVKVYTGSSPHGQGEETTFAQLASQELGVPLEDVSVVWGDTALIPAGIGTFGSRSAATGGSAVVDASRKLRAELFEGASGILGAEASSLAVRGGRVVSPTGRTATVAEVLDRLGTPELSSESVFRLGASSYSTTVHVCAVTVDAELGKVKVSKYVVVEDCGRMINEAIVDGQLHGGVVHALGGSLFERLVYDDQGNLLSSTFMDYNIPTSLDSPTVEVFHESTPSTATLDGAKGVGESGTNAGYAAVMNAVNDALSRARPGAKVNIAPATPEAICAALSSRGV